MEASTLNDEQPRIDMEISPALELGKRLIRSILDFDSLDSINQLINAESAPLWYQDPEEGGISALHAAAFAENFELVKLLITKGAMWNASKYVVFLCAAIRFGCS